MNMLQTVLFKNYWVPPATSDKTFAQIELETTKHKRIHNARQQIIDAMRSLGHRCTTTEICKATDDVLYINLVNRHLEKMRSEGLVRHAGWATIKPQGGQRSRLWRLCYAPQPV